MKGLLRSSKFKAILIPIVIFLVLALVLILTILKQEQRLPSKGWSRGIGLNSTLSSSDAYPVILKENGFYHIYTISNQTVNEIVLNNNLETENKASLPVHIPNKTQFWTDGNQVAFVKNNQLINVEQGRSTVLAQNVNGLTPFGHEFLFWKSNQLYEMQPTSHQIKKVVQTPFPIDSVVTKTESKYLLIKSQVVKNESVHIGVVDLTDGGRYHPLDTLDQPYNATLEDFDFVAHQNSMYVVYCEYGSTSGGMYRNNYLGAYNLNTFKKQRKTALLTIENNLTKLTFLLPTNIRINWVNGGLALIFQEQSTLFRGEDAQNIFLAKEHGHTWIAQPISSSVEPSASPVWLTDHSVLWNDNIGNSYTLMLGSQNPTQIHKSLNLTQKDWGNAISRALMNMTISLLMIAYALLWVIPTMVFIIIMFIGNMTLMERNPYWVKTVSIVLFIITQLIFIKGLFNSTFHLFSPSFLQFPGNWIIIPVLIAGISWILTEWIKGKEWGNSLFVFYCLLIDVLMVSFLIGPYTL
jgi:hypothetical protein